MPMVRIGLRRAAEGRVAKRPVVDCEQHQVCHALVRRGVGASASLTWRRGSAVKTEIKNCGQFVGTLAAFLVVQIAVSP